MKTFIRLSQVIAVICMLTGCESCDTPEEGHIDSHDPVTGSIDTRFNTSFIKSAIGIGNNSDPVCICRLEQFGWGSDTELGSFEVYLTCCWNPGDGSHSCTEGFITDYNGNTLTILCKDGDNGVDFTSDFPYDQTVICSEFEFTGGTGRFEGATGIGTMECEVKGSYNLILHHWDASLTLLME